MKLKLIFISILFSCKIFAQNKIQLSSPDGNIIYFFLIENNTPKYSVTYNHQALINTSSLNLVFNDGKPFQHCLMQQQPTFLAGVDDYDLIVGKTSHVHQAYKKAIIYLSGDNYLINLEIKTYNDGVAFRYVFPKQKNKNLFILLDEQTQFNVANNPTVKTLLFPNFTSSHEGLYQTMPLNKLKADTLMDLPVTFQSANNTYLAITESALLDYAGMYLKKHNGILQSQLSPLPALSGVGRIKVKANFPHQSPWRVMLISNRLGALIESNIITNVAPPLAIKYTDWIKTGTTTFPWWYGTVVPDSIKGGNNFETNKYFIDFCAANNVLYHTVVEYGGHEWYTNDGEGYQPGKNFDVTKPVDGLDMKKICDYAHSKGVGIRVWVHWKALYPKLDEAFSIFEQWGLSGMMVDFMDRDDQEMVNIQTEILQKAAAHHLHIQFHGAYKPTGLNRTYPNEFTREGAMNYEYDKWEKFVTPDADLNIVFTRMLAGSTDYHLGGFRASNLKDFVPQNIHPFVVGTRCHMLAMYVVLESYQGMMCDDPQAYIGQPGFEVLQHIPTTWDETKVLKAKLDNYVSIARRKNNDWYIGSIGNHDSHDLNLDLKFLLKGKYTATIYSDANDDNINPNHLIKKIINVDNTSSIKINLASGGGNVIILHKT